MRKNWHRSALFFFFCMLGTFGFLAVPVFIHAVGESAVTIQIDGVAIDPPVDPVIREERTLVPARAIFEAMGGQVSWNGDIGEVIVTLDRNEVRLLIGKKDTYVNDQRKTLDVPAAIIDGSTMIPIRFVAESIGAKVDWDNDSRTIRIESPPEPTNIKIGHIRVVELDQGVQVVISGDQRIHDFKNFVLQNPNRFVIDIPSAELFDSLSAALPMQSRKIDGVEGIFSQVRFAQFEPEVVRVVLDLEQEHLGSVSLSEDQKSLLVNFDRKKPTRDAEFYGLPKLDWKASLKHVVIDPGHGGSDTGAIGYQNGKAVLYEKNLNLDIAQRLTQYLSAAGVRTTMLRDSDTSILLADRPHMANLMRADLLVGIHNNDYKPNRQASGTEVYFTNLNQDLSRYGISSKRLAQLTQSELVPALGTIDRQIRNGETLSVIRRAKMPAIIVEGVYLSNANDLALALTDAYRENYAKATATAIIKALNESVSPVLLSAE